MKVLESIEITLKPSDLDPATYIYRPWPCDERPKGVHLSGCLDVLEVGVLGTKAGNYKTSIDESNLPLIVFLGHCWEAGCVALYPEIEWQPGTFESDGITGTPDGKTNYFVGQFTGAEGKAGWANILEEFKYTTKKLQPVEGIWRYIRQGMGYCALTGLNHVRYHVCFAKGNYADRQFPIYTRTLIEFSQQEIDMFWKAVVNVKERAKPE